MLKSVNMFLAALSRGNVIQSRIAAGSIGLLLLIFGLVYFVQIKSIETHNISHPSLNRILVPVNRSVCCSSFNGSEDVCGRPNCTSTCPDPLSTILDQRDPNEQTAFLIETLGNPVLDIRQACSVESLAFHNPSLTIYVLFSNGRINTEAVVMTTLIQNYRNVRLVPIDLNEFLVGTPLERWYHCTDWKTGPYHVAHLSDGIRLITLFKYGGFYFDLDIIHTRPVINCRNFIAAESGDTIANGAINIDKNHPIIQLTVKDFALNYRSNLWSYNGPELWLRVLTNWCGVKDVNSMDYVRCRGFSVLPRASFYPIHYSIWREFFNPRNETKQLDWLTRDIIGVHVWNKLSFNETVYRNSTQYYAQLARAFCPRIMSIAPDTY